MTTSPISAGDVRRAIESAARDLVRTERIGESWYINLPLLYPDGSYVTVRVDQAPGGVRVSDDGFAFREAEDVEAPRGSFRRTAASIAERTGVSIDGHAIYVDTSLEALERAVNDVAETSWRVADRICQRAFEDDDQGMSEALVGRLRSIFGSGNVVPNSPNLVGASANEWAVSAVVNVSDGVAVFQAVSEQANSIYKAATAFRDLAGVPRPPRLIAVVNDVQALGSKVSLLAPAKVIESGQSDAIFIQAAA